MCSLRDTSHYPWIPLWGEDVRVCMWGCVWECGGCLRVVFVCMCEGMCTYERQQEEGNKVYTGSYVVTFWVRNESLFISSIQIQKQPFRTLIVHSTNISHCALEGGPFPEHLQGLRNCQPWHTLHMLTATIQHTSLPLKSMRIETIPWPLLSAPSARQLLKIWKIGSLVEADHCEFHQTVFSWVTRNSQPECHTTVPDTLKS